MKLSGVILLILMFDMVAASALQLNVSLATLGSLNSSKANSSQVENVSMNNSSIDHMLQNSSPVEWAIVAENASMSTQTKHKNYFIKPNSPSRSGDTSSSQSSSKGSNDMAIHDQKSHSAKGFFDSTTAMPPAPCKTDAPVTKGPYGY